MRKTLIPILLLDSCSRQERFAVILLVFVFGFAGQALAQTATGSLHGFVSDPLGAAVTTATVQVTDASGKTTTANTGKDGTYQFMNLAPGQYNIRALSKGFSLYEVDGITVPAGQAPKLDISLAIQVEETHVNVSDQGTVVDTSAANNASQIVLTGMDLDALPDDTDQLADDLQALAGPSAGPNGGQIYLDGFTGGQVPPKSSIREVRINQNPFSSEYDKLGYGRIEIFTRPGSNQLHGQLFVMGNSSAFNSKNPFASQQPSYNSQQYSGSLSGPIGRKASFFLNGERRNISDAAAVNAYVLGPAPDFTPQPYNTSILVPRTRTNLGPRIDYQITPNNTLTARYHYWSESGQSQGVGQFSLPSQAYNSSNTEQTFQLSDTQLFGAKIVNETRFLYQRERSTQRPFSRDAAVNVIGGFLSGGNSGGYIANNQDNYELQNYTSVLAGKHYFKFGARLRDKHQANYANSGFNGTFTFESLTSYQITEQGLAQGWTPQQIRNAGGGASQFVINTGRPGTTVNFFDVNLYFQDEWRWRPNFTISYGLRWETQTDIHDHGDWAPRLSFAWGLSRGNNPSPKTVLRAGWGMFYERFDEQYVLQADRLNGATQQRYVVNQPNFFPVVPPIDLVNPAKTFPTVYQISPNLRSAYVMQAAVSLERQIAKNANVAVSYLHSQGLHQYLTRNINAPFPATYNPADPTSGVRPFGNAAGNIYQYESSGKFDQDQFIINANVRIGAKLSLFGYYTLNNVNSNTTGASSFPMDQYSLAASYGQTAFDVHQRVFVGGTVAMPRGFRISPFLVASSAVPFNITLGQDYNGDSIFNDRPTFATDLSSPSVVVTRYGAFDTQPKPGQTVIPPYYAWGPPRFSLNLRLSKTFGFGGESGLTKGGDTSGPGGGVCSSFGKALGGPMGLKGVTTRRYSLTFSANARDVFNNVNVSPLVGNLSSPLFGHANALAGGAFGSTSANRRIDLQVVLSF